MEFTGEIISEAGYGREHHRNSSLCNHGDELRQEGVGREGWAGSHMENESQKCSVIGSSRYSFVEIHIFERGEA